MAGASALADKAMTRFSVDRAPNALLATVGASYLASKRYADAAELLEHAVRQDPKDEGVLRVLLSAMLRDSELRSRHTERLEAKHKADPGDTIAQFLLGIVYHYANRFEESSALLAPLEAEMGHQSRLHIYLAMNDFNMERREQALARLDAGEDRPNPDPDIFYCRAEILRDTKREQARADLARYQAMSRGSYMSNPDKTARVQGMIADLDGCIASGVAVCKSHWEHPRLKIHASSVNADEGSGDQPPPDAEDSPLKWLVIAALALGLAWALWRRRPLT